MKYAVRLTFDPSGYYVIETKPEEITKFVAALNAGSQFVTMMDLHSVPHVFNAAAIVYCGPYEDEEKKEE